MIPGIMAGQMRVAAPPVEVSPLHLHWRINITQNAGNSGYTAIEDIQMRALLSGADQCVGGTAAASTALSGYEAYKAFDGSSASWWSTTYASVTGWIRYSFPSAVEVRQYTIRAHPSAGDRSPASFSLEYSDDGVAWTVADSRTGELGWANGETRVYQVPS